MALPWTKDPDYWDEELEYQVQSRQRPVGLIGWSNWYKVTTHFEARTIEAVAKEVAAKMFANAQDSTETRRQYRVVAVQKSYRVVERYT